MIQSIHTAVTALQSQQKRLDVVGNNLANVQTPGYKSMRADFKDALYQTQVRPVAPQDDLNMELGHGVLLGNTIRNFKNGAILTSSSKTDFALEGEGFFAIEGSDGETLYTRDGSFQLSVEDGGNYLVTGDGHYVLDANGGRIAVTEEWSKIKVSTSGALINENGDEYAQIGVFRFDNPEGLEAAGDNRYTVTDASGEAADDEATLVHQSYLENSNVELADEFTRLIRTQRSMTLASKALQAADDMEGQAINLRT